MRDYGTGTWEGGDEDCNHREATIRTRRNLAAAANACDGGNRKAEDRTDFDALGIPYRDLCGKCGAVRVDQQMGLEPSLEAYVAGMVAVFEEVRRVLRDDGTLWLNLGDAYANDGKWGGSSGGKHVEALHGNTGIGRQKTTTGLKPKDLCGMPWRVALALQAAGWWLRSDVIWHKPNPMPSSQTDRPTCSHEYMFLLTKKSRYWYDAEAVAEPSVQPKRKRNDRVGGASHEERQQHSEGGRVNGGSTRSLRSVWTIATAPFPDAHFATFPPKLVEPCVRAGCPGQVCAECGAPWVRVVEQSGEWRAQHERDAKHTGDVYRRNPGGGLKGPNTTRMDTDLGFRATCSCPPGTATVPGLVFDPFCGSGTTLAVALAEGRRALGFELNPEYVQMAEQRARKAEREYQPALFAE